MKQSRIILISNRLSVSVKRNGQEGFVLSPSIGGLATGLASLQNEAGVRWIGWSGVPEDKIGKKDSAILKKRLIDEYGSHPVPLTTEHIRYYYEGFSNNTLWPLFHYFPTFVRYEEKLWNAYKTVNELFFNEVKKVGKETDIFWIHDYQLMLLPALIRKAFPKAQIGFFLHIPFPSFEIFRLLPWRSKLLEGVLGADLVGFHSYDYARHFLSSVRRILGYDHNLGLIYKENGLSRVDVFPMGIDNDRFKKIGEEKEIREESERIRKELKNRRIIFSVDRLDYTKGIPLRLRAFARLLEKMPEYREKVVLVFVVAPSRTNVTKYKDLRREIEELVGSINGAFGTIGWEPVRYYFRSFSQEKLVSLYMAADVLLVTPLRDGMNLVAKEYIAVRSDNTGALVLSENAGAAEELGEAFIVNPNDIEDIIAAISSALTLSVMDQKTRMKKMRERIEKYSVSFWAKDFLDNLSRTSQRTKVQVLSKLVGSARKRLSSDYAHAHKRLLLLDYDGTLRPFVKVPEMATPDDELLDILSRLSSDPRNEIVIVSGRDRDFLEKNLGHLRLGFVAGHGVWIRRRGEEWHPVISHSVEWKNVIFPIMERFSVRTPGAFIEEKDFSLAWHYRRAEPDLSAVRIAELKDALYGFISSYQLSVLEGNRVLEVKPSDINKGSGVVSWITEKNHDFILAMGDDVTDEDLFQALPRNGYSIKVGGGFSQANFSVANTEDARSLLGEFLLISESN